MLGNGLRRLALELLPAMAAIYLAVTSPALAGCNTFTPASNDTVTCDGANVQGVIADSSTGVFLNLINAGSIIPPSGFAIDLGTGATVNLGAGTTTGNATASNYAVVLNGGSTITIDGLLTGKGGISAPIVANGVTGAHIVLHDGGQITNTGNNNTWAINGKGGNNTYQIDGDILATDTNGGGIQVGNNDNVTLGSTGSITVQTPASASPILGSAATGVSVGMAKGSQIDTSSIGPAINLGAAAHVTIDGTITDHTTGSAGVWVGAGSTVWLQQDGLITNTVVIPPTGVGGGAISAGIDSTVIVDGTINMGGTGAGVVVRTGSTITIGATGKVTAVARGAEAAIDVVPTTSAGNDTMTVDVAGQVLFMGGDGGGHRAAIFADASPGAGPPFDVSARLNVTIEPGALVYAEKYAAYGQYDGFGSFPEVIDNLIIAGDMETGVVNGVAIDLNDGADTLTLLPTYKIVGKIDGGSDAAGLPETDTLAFDGAANTSGAFSFDTNPVLNFEAGHKTGAGTWTLSGTAGPGLTGNFAVDTGRLSVNGTMTSTTFTVASGATLAGIGSLGATTILAGGFHAPGNSIGTETILGNYANHGTLLIEVSPTDADKVVVTGDVDIGSANLVLTEVTGTGWSQSQTYTIIDNQGANPVTGTFASITDNLAFLDPTVVYTGGSGNDVVLTVLRNNLAFASAGLTPNEIAAAGGAESLGGGNPVYDAIVPLTTGGAPAAFDQLSGEIHASLAGAMLADSRTPREAALARVDAAFAAIADMQAGHGRNVWTRSLGDLGIVVSDGNAAQMNFQTAGFMAGVDQWIGRNTLLGIEGGVTFGALVVPDRNSSAMLDGMHLGLYGGAAFDDVRLGFGAALSATGAHITRKPVFPGLSQTLDSDSAAVAAQLFGELGYAFTADAGSLEPFARLALIHLESSPFAETGGSAALSGKAAPLNAALVTLGLHGSADIPLPGEQHATLKGTFGWEDLISPTPTATNAFAVAAPFVVSGAPRGSQLVLETDLALGLGASTSLDLSYHGGLGSGGARHAFVATLQGSF